MNVKTKVLLEVAGFPKEHVEKTIKAVIDTISKNKDYKLEENEFLQTEEKEGVFSAISEATITFQDISDLYGFCFDFMPSSVDIIEPEEMKITAREFNASLNDLLATLHNHDMFLKNSNAKLKIVTNNLTNLLSNFILHLTEKEIEMAELSKQLGIPEEHLKSFIEEMEKQNLITRNGNKCVKK